MRIGTDRAYIYALVFASSLALAAWLHVEGVSLDLFAFMGATVLGLVCAASRGFEHRFGRASAKITDVSAVTAMVVLGPVWAILTLLPDMIYRDRLRTAFVASGDVIKLLAGGGVFYLFSSPLMSGSAALDGRFAYGAVAGAATLYAVDALVNSGLMRLKYGDPFSKTLKEVFLPLVPSSFVAVSVALGVAATLSVYGPAAALVGRLSWT